MVNLLSGRERQLLTDVLFQATGLGPYSGADLVLALAIERRMGGHLVALKSEEGAEHAAVQVNGMLVDFEGAFAPGAMIENFRHWQNLDASSSPVHCQEHATPADFPGLSCDEGAIAQVEAALPAELADRLERARKSLGLEPGRPRSPSR